MFVRFSSSASISILILTIFHCQSFEGKQVVGQRDGVCVSKCWGRGKEGEEGVEITRRVFHFLAETGK